MGLSATKRAEVQGLIVQGLGIREIVDQTKVSRATVYQIKADLEHDAAKNRVDELGKASPAILREVALGIKARAPLALEGEVEKLLDAAESLQRLEISFHSSFDNILKRANAMLDDDGLSLVDWQIITNTLAGAFKDIYNSKGTTINVAQAGNVSNGNSLSMFQGRL
jgi:hypothetical protein